MPRSKCAFVVVSLWFITLATICGAADRHSVGLPLTFEPNRGQADSETIFLGRTPGATVALTRDGVVLSDEKQGVVHSVRICFRGMAGAKASAESATGGYANYYRSQDRNRWLSHIPLYSRVRYASVAPGIDAVFHGNQSRLEYDFEIASFASPGNIRFSLEGADKFYVAPDGGIEFRAGGAAWRLLPPAAYQVREGARKGVSIGYKIGRDGSVGFAVGAYDRSIPLTIDPVVQYADLISVNNNTHVAGIQVDSAGNLFIAGDTFSTNYPVVHGNPPELNSSEEIFISKLDPTNSNILYSTYIPASGFSTANGLALDPNGNAYVTGVTDSTDFPLTSTALGSCSTSCSTGFVAKFAPDGTMAYATLLSPGEALPKGIVVDGAGSAYVAGLAGANLPTVNAFQPTFVGPTCTSCTDAFFGKLNPSGTGYVFASYFANPNQSGVETFATGIGIDGAGNIYLAGQGDPPIFNPWQIGGALFIAKFASDGQTLLFSSGFGGSSGSIAGVAVGNDGTLFIAGQAPADFPFTLNASSLMAKDNGNGLFAAAVNPALTGLTYSTYIGDGNVDAMFLNPANNHLFVGGLTVTNLPGLVNAVVSDVGHTPGFAMELDATGKPVTVTQFGGHLDQEVPTAIASDGSGNLYIAGAVSPDNGFPQDPILVGSNLGLAVGTGFGAFIAKIAPANAPQISLNTQPPFLVLRNAGSADLHISSITFGGGLAQQLGNCANTVPAGTSCFLTVTDGSGLLAGGTVTITSDALPSVQTFQINLPQGVNPGASIPDLLTFSDTPTIFPPQLTGTNTSSRTFSISNIGAANGNLNAFFANGGVVQTNDCPGTLIPGASCSIHATVTAGAGQPSLRISYDNGILQDYELFVPVTTSQFLLSTSGISFGIQQINGVAVPRVVTVTNTSDTAGTPPAPSLAGDPEIVISGTTCVGSLPPHGSCGIAGQFNPVIDGTRNATLTVGDGQVQFSGQGEFNSVIQLSPLELTFFPVIVHRAPVAEPLTLSNTSASPVGIASITFSLPDYTETDNCSGQVPAGNSCAVQVNFVAQAVGPRDATMTINFTGGVAPQTLTLSGGVGVTPMDVTPSVLNFGSVLDNTTSTSQSVVLGNGRQGTPQAYTLSVSGDFTITQNPCSNPMPGDFGCTIQVAFAPKNPGTQQGALTVSYPGISEQSVVTLNGTGVASGAIFNAPATLDSGNVNVGTAVSTPLTISNTGNADLTIAGYTLGGANPGQFSVAPGQCPTITAGNTCSIQVSFNPSSPLQQQATLTFADNGLNNPHTVTLTGTGVGPLIELPGPTFIGQALIGEFTTNQLLLINHGNANLVISSVTFTGANSGDFSANLNTCGTMAGPSTCSITVTFTPSAPGTRTANIVFNDNEIFSPQSFAVTGTGLGAAYTVPASLNFGNQLRGTVSAQQVIQVTNTGTVALGITSLSATGDFSGTHNCLNVNPLASCSITLTFAPTAAGTRNGTLTLTDDTPQGSHQIALTGNGTDFQLVVPGNGSATATVAAGQTATYNLNLAGSGGYTGTVTLSCTGAPQSAACTVSPSTIQITNSTPTAFSVTVTTQVVVSSALRAKGFWGVFGALVFAPLILLTTSRRMRSRGGRLLCAAVLGTCLGALGCGGGGGGGGGGGPKVQTTPPGTYTLTLTATGSGVTRQSNLTLVVQ